MKTIASLALVTLLVASCFDPAAENWQRRWNEDTKALAEELTIAAQKIADVSNENAKLRNADAALRSELMELRKAATSAP